MWDNKESNVNASADREAMVAHIEHLESLVRSLRERVGGSTSPAEHSGGADPTGAADFELLHLKTNNSADELDVDSNLYRKARETLEKSYESASTVRLEALNRVREEIRSAGQEAMKIMERGREQAKLLLDEASIKSEMALQRSRREAENIVGNARQEETAILRLARQEAERIIGTARLEAEEARRVGAEALQQAINEREDLERMRGVQPFLEDSQDEQDDSQRIETGWLRSMIDRTK